jgi:hypothetical protein
MAKAAKKPGDADVNREIQRYSMAAFELAKKSADGSLSDEEKATAQEMAKELPDFSAKARELSDRYRPGASKTLADARLDFSYIASDGAVPSSTRLGWYIKEKGEDAGA